MKDKKRKGIFNNYKGEPRKEAQKFCRENAITDEQFHFLSIYKWNDVYEKILINFADDSWRKYYGLHWLNTNGRFIKEKKYSFTDDKNWEWIFRLEEIIGKDEMIYVALEDEKDKLWLAEGTTNVIARIIYEEFFADDYYIVDKKYQWMITRNHHEYVMFIGDFPCDIPDYFEGKLN